FQSIAGCQQIYKTCLRYFRKQRIYEKVFINTQLEWNNLSTPTKNRKPRQAIALFLSHLFDRASTGFSQMIFGWESVRAEWFGDLPWEILSSL
ncbi:MAG: hypothetical protein OXH34_02655, partial [Bacteroidetes bacterium]|nr:hypothetical protein [Bacteroidota bacterium]